MDSRFGKSSHLLTQQEFDLIFAKPDFRVSNQHVLILAKNQRRPYARLGLVVAKKKIPKAVTRNRFKRLSREHFRLRKESLSGLDLIVLARANIQDLSEQQQNQIFESVFTNLIENIPVS